MAIETIYHRPLVTEEDTQLMYVLRNIIFNLKFQTKYRYRFISVKCFILQTKFRVYCHPILFYIFIIITIIFEDLEKYIILVDSIFYQS